ncbi:hypothetical protein [Acinetobacter modestus]|uniref:hypothetical protein n=1 Tax=Acinetobacter modestus TaxID=1776740 RepID=UPI00301AF4B9
MHKEYEEWLMQQEIYKTLVYQHGDQTLIRENRVYKILAVQLGYQVWRSHLLRYAFLFKEHQEMLLDLAYYKNKAGVVSCSQEN